MIRGGGDPDDPRVVPVYALTGGRARSRGLDLNIETLVSTTQEGMMSLAHLRFDEVRVEPDRVLGTPGASAGALGRALERATVAAAL